MKIFIKYCAFIAAAASVLALMLGRFEIIPLSQSGMALITLLMASILLITELIPLAVGAMVVPIALALTGVLSPTEVFLGFSNENVILFSAMFIVGGAMFRTGFAQLIGVLVTQNARGNSKHLLLYVMLVTALFSSVMSNTGTVAVLLPICIGIADSSGIERRYILLPLAMTASLGGMITLVGCPPNMTVSAVLEEYCQESIGFLEFAWIGIPATVIGCLFMFLAYKDKLPPLVDSSFLSQTPKFSKTQLASAGIFLGVIIIMATGIINLALGASIGALVCLLIGLVNQKEAIEDIDWTTIFLFAGMLPLADALEKTGAGKLIADRMVGVMGQHASEFVILTLLFFTAALLTQFMSNTVACSLLAPIAAQIALAMNANPKAVLLIIAAGSSAAFATPMATPPNTLVMGPAKVEFSDYFKIGVPLIAITYSVCMAIVMLKWPFFNV